MKHASIGLCILLMMGTAAQASAHPIPWLAEDGGNNHHYDGVRVAEGVTWEEARAMAAEMTHRGVPGHLATLVSQGEYDFVWDELGDVKLYWLGGFQGEGDFAPDEGWEWVTGEPWAFAFWEPGEPNNYLANPDGFENRLQIGRYSEPTGWNDLWPSAMVPGFIVEFDTDTVSDESASVGEVKSRY